MAESCRTIDLPCMEPETESLKVESAKHLVWRSSGSPERSTVADIFRILPTGYGTMDIRQDLQLWIP